MSIGLILTLAPLGILLVFSMLFLLSVPFEMAVDCYHDGNYAGAAWLALIILCMLSILIGCGLLLYEHAPLT